MQVDNEENRESNKKRYDMHTRIWCAFCNNIRLNVLWVLVSTRMFKPFSLPRYPVSRPGNNPGRVKRVVSCKRKTHHVISAWKRQLGSGRTLDSANKENEINLQQDIFDMDAWEFPINVNNNHKPGRTGSEESDYCALSEVSTLSQFKQYFMTVSLLCTWNHLNLMLQLTVDHSTMTEVLFGRNLRLKVALTLWQRNVGELLTYLLRYTFVDLYIVTICLLELQSKIMCIHLKCYNVTVFTQNTRH